MGGLSVAAWFHEQPAEDVRRLLLGFVVGPLRWVTGPPEGRIGSWDLVTLEGEPLFIGLSPWSEGRHSALELVCRHESARVKAAFDEVFSQLVASTTPRVAECTLAYTTMDLYPWFTPPFHRLGGVVDEDRGATHALGSPGFWELAGEQLHFVHADTLARAPAPDPRDYARRIHAVAEPLGPGWLFRCGARAGGPA